MPSARLLELAPGLPDRASRQDLVLAVLRSNFAAAGLGWGEGVLDVLPEGYGFLRTSGYLPGSDDVYCRCRKSGGSRCARATR
jgi:transcription termination factor Rho